MLVSSVGMSQTLSIPDTVFFNALISAGIDTNSDGLIQQAEAELVEDLNLRNKGISSLEGIEGFVNLRNLDCSSNEIDTLVVNGLSFLEKLDCYNGSWKLSRLYDNMLEEWPLFAEDFSQGTKTIRALRLKNLPSLIELNCAGHFLDSLDLSGVPALEVLRCANNELTVLETSQVTSLKVLNCERNNISTLDLSQNIKLYEVFCTGNEIKSLDLFSNPLIRRIRCFYLDCLGPIQPSSLLDFDGSASCLFNESPRLNCDRKDVSTDPLAPVEWDLVGCSIQSCTDSNSCVRASFVSGQVVAYNKIHKRMDSLSGISLTLEPLGYTTSTDGNGRYNFNILDTGRYSVVIDSLADYEFDKSEIEIHVNTHQTFADRNFISNSTDPDCALIRAISVLAYDGQGGGRLVPFVNYTSLYFYDAEIVIGNQNGQALYRSANGYDGMSPGIIEGYFNGEHLYKEHIYEPETRFGGLPHYVEIPKNDLSTHVLNFAQFSSGESCEIVVRYMNEGTTPLHAQLTVTVPELFSVDDTLIASNVAGQEVTYDLGVLLPKEWGEKIIYGSIDPIASTGMEMIVSSGIANLDVVSDTNRRNDSHTVRFTREDLEDFSLFSSHMIVPDSIEPITYILQFENTTSDTLFYASSNISLPANLNPNSIQILGASFLVNSEIHCPGFGPGCGWSHYAVLNLIMTEMSLGPGERGFVTFQLEPWESSEEGAFIALSADITFNCDVLYSTELGIDKSFSTFAVSSTAYPNPIVSGHQLSFDSDDLMKVELYDDFGKRRYVFREPSGIVIPANLVSGIYMLKIFEEDRVYWSRLVIE